MSLSTTKINHLYPWYKFGINTYLATVWSDDPNVRLFDFSSSSLVQKVFNVLHDNLNLLLVEERRTVTLSVIYAFHTMENDGEFLKNVRKKRKKKTLKLNL